MFSRSNNFEKRNCQVSEPMNNINLGYLNKPMIPFQDNQSKIFPNNFSINGNDKFNKFNLGNICNFNNSSSKAQSAQNDDNNNYQINTLNLNLQNNTHGHNFENGPYSFY